MNIVFSILKLGQCIELFVRAHSILPEL